MKRLIKKDGSAVNTLTPSRVKVGDGVSFYAGSDCYPCTIVDMTASGKTISFTMDKVTVTDGNYYDSSSIKWTSERVEPYTRTEYGVMQTNVKVARWNNSAREYRYQSRPLIRGRHYHMDPSK